MSWFINNKLRAVRKNAGGGANPYPPGVNFVASQGLNYSQSAFVFSGDESIIYAAHGNGNQTRNILTSPATFPRVGAPDDWGGGVVNGVQGFARGQNGFKRLHTKTSQLFDSEFSVSDDWQPSTVIYTNNLLLNIPASVGALVSNMSIKPDGLSVFFTVDWWQNPKRIAEMKTPVAWDFTQLVFDNYQLDNVTWAIPRQVRFSNDGMRGIISDRDNNRLIQWELNSPFDLRTMITPASSILTLGYAPDDFHFAEQGKKLFIAQYSSAMLHEYTLNPAYSI